MGLDNCVASRKIVLLTAFSKYTGGMFGIKQSFQVPSDFSPPFKPNIVETYQGKGEFKSAKAGLEDLKENLPKGILKLLDLRNAAVTHFGFETDFSPEEYGPFEVKFLQEDHAIIQFEESNFSFYGELKTQPGSALGHFAVVFKSLKGRLYFYTIFPGHYIIFKYLLSRLKIPANSMA